MSKALSVVVSVNSIERVKERNVVLFGMWNFKSCGFVE
jgi:hypothetical protein